MAETTEKQAPTKPFWLSEEEWKARKLPKLDGNIAGAVAKGIPELTWVEKGALIGAWVIKDGLLLYHFYKKDRKEIYDAAQANLETARQQASKETVAEWQARVSAHANEELEKRPWWPNFKEVLNGVFKEHFRFHPFKIDYYPEVDSWSVVMTELDTPMKWSQEQYELPFTKVAKLVEC